MFRKTNSINWKSVALKIAILLVLSISLAAAITVMFINYSNSIYNHQLRMSAAALKRDMESAKKRTEVAAISFAKNPDVIEAIEKYDRAALHDLCAEGIELYDVTYFTIADSQGRVVFRSVEPEHYGDFISKQQNIKDALSGAVGSYYEEGTEAKVSARTGAPVLNRKGEVTGVISVGYRLDTNEYADEMKRVYGVEVTVFNDNIRVATTIEENGKRILWTKLIDPDIVEAVLNRGHEYFGETMVFGHEYLTVYMPIYDSSNEVFAVILAAFDEQAEMEASYAFFIKSAMVSSLFILIFYGLILYLKELEDKALKDKGKNNT